MLKKSIVVAGAFLFISSVFAADPLPTVEFIKDGEVIESREMTFEEVEAYNKIQQMELKLEAIEEPLEQFEDQIDDQAELIEQQVEQIIAAAMEGEVVADLSAFSELGELKFDKLNEAIAQMQPALDEVTEMADDIRQTTERFKVLILADYQDNEIDKVRIVDDEDDNFYIR